jgi:hypothetical protein
MTVPGEQSEVDDGLEEEIRRRAYDRYLARGPDEGTDVDDWLRAAEELREGLRSKDDEPSKTLKSSNGER